VSRSAFSDRVDVFIEQLRQRDPIGHLMIDAAALGP
jgi:hypothetical protein